MRKLRYAWHFKKNLNLAYPVMLSQSGHVLVGFADSIMVGQVGTVPLAAASLSNALFFFPLMFGIGVTYGITPHVASSDGDQDLKSGIEYLKHGTVIAFILSLLLFGFIFTIIKFPRILAQEKEVIDQSLPYLFVIGLSIIPVLLFQSFRQFVEGLSYTKLVMVVVIVSNVLNVVLNYVLIFGKLGFEPLGLLGAGYATLIARLIMAIALIMAVFYQERFKKYISKLNFKSLSWGKFNDILKVGLPAGLQFVFEIGAFSFTAVMIGWIGAPSLAAHQIAMNLISLTYMLASGIAAASTIRVSNQFGRKDKKTLREAGLTSFATVLVLMTFTGLIFIVFKHILPALYVDDPPVISIASTLLVVGALFQISDGVQVVSLGALRGIKDVRIPTLFTFIAYWVIGLPIGYLFGFLLNLGAKGVWFGLLAGLTISAVLNSLRFNTLSKKLMFN